MKRAIFAVVVAVAVGVLAFTLYNRTDAGQSVVPAVHEGTSASCGSSCGGGSCRMSTAESGTASASSEMTGEECCPGGAECDPSQCSRECLEECVEKCEQLVKEGKCPPECLEKCKRMLEEKKESSI